MKNIYIDTEQLNKELTNLKNQREKLNNIANQIKNNYHNFQNYNMEGPFVIEVNNNYDYGLEITNKLIEKLDLQIEKIEYALNKYLETIKEIETKVGDKNE